jgi:hypothetical protein
MTFQPAPNPPEARKLAGGAGPYSPYAPRGFSSGEQRPVRLPACAGQGVDILHASSRLTGRVAAVNPSALYGSHLPAVPVLIPFARLCPTGRAEAHDGGPPPGRRRVASFKNITVVHHRGRLDLEYSSCPKKIFAKPAK